MKMELSRDFVKAVLPKRDPAGHKGTFGKVLCVCGSVGYTGAPIYAASAAVRSGSGLVFLGVPRGIWQVAAVKCTSAMPFPLCGCSHLSRFAEKKIRERLDRCDAALIGCGLGRTRGVDRLVLRLLDTPLPLVLDADALGTLSGHLDALQVRRDRVTVVTPHEGEFARLGGDLSQSREEAAASFAQIHRVYVVLKGHRTVIAAPDGRIAVNPTGNSGMAKGGAGDILAGMITSLLGQGMAPFAACCAAVWLHGTAGDLAAEALGERGMTPDDLLAQIPFAFQKAEN